MTDAPGYDYDIFISYAHVDNEPIHPAQQGWVDALIRLLHTDLTMKFGRREAFSIWFDEQQLRGNHEINGHISEQVRRSAVFLAVLSPGYVASQACLRELQTDLLGSLRNAQGISVVTINEILHFATVTLRNLEQDGQHDPNLTKIRADVLFEVAMTYQFAA